MICVYYRLCVVCSPLNPPTKTFLTFVCVQSAIPFQYWRPSLSHLPRTASTGQKDRDGSPTFWPLQRSSRTKKSSRTDVIQSKIKKDVM